MAMVVVPEHEVGSPWARLLHRDETSDDDQGLVWIAIEVGLRRSRRVVGPMHRVAEEHPVHPPRIRPVRLLEERREAPEVFETAVQVRVDEQRPLAR